MFRYMKASHIHVCRLLNISGLLLSGRDGGSGSGSLDCDRLLFSFLYIYICVCVVRFVVLFQTRKSESREYGVFILTSFVFAETQARTISHLSFIVWGYSYEAPA
ncbi:hypothetical protein BO82DRAFT_105770 [Aspergillus uvarum CBS 121591]|uniref:Uncharacterized protein n=1 Tax=Aspergillus uvarum CBS 121591 TaxID=1448315 RepID=A0A319C614_9EURO|nr:hypothetical protein BO82DRAFT_105770 [Aspergillus uvarum CBS 121591]PYH80624.1 hypothetical protein BO82DRAFT_105770 [Aspergillus uvarum CBS 121591]